jgi:hypothetical protein
MRGHLLVGLTAYRDAHVPVPAEFSKPVCAMCLSRDSWVELLLSKGANVNAQGGENGNALQAASANGHSQIVELLLSKGANFNA